MGLMEQPVSARTRTPANKNLGGPWATALLGAATGWSDQELHLHLTAGKKRPEKSSGLSGVTLPVGAGVESGSQVPPLWVQAPGSHVMSHSTGRGRGRRHAAGVFSWGFSPASSLETQGSPESWEVSRADTLKGGIAGHSTRAVLWAPETATLGTGASAQGQAPWSHCVPAAGSPRAAGSLSCLSCKDCLVCCLPFTSREMTAGD